MPPPPQPQLREGGNEALRFEGRQGVGGSKRCSRAIWDSALRPPASASRWRRWRCLVRAILYELQPLRYSEALELSRSGITSTSSTLRSVCNLAQCLPRHASATWLFLREHMTLQRCGIILVCIIYYWIVRVIHEWLDAGPIVLIITAMIAIFTVGLRDEDDRQGLSAYSVFNRGFQRIMGTVDAEELMQQHVGAAGGGMMAFAMAPNVHQQEVRGDNGDANRERQPIRGREAAQEVPNEAPQQPRDAPERAGARKSGKKARRQNLEQRRELRRQREAAMALGFGDGNDELQELLAMQRLGEEDDIHNFAD